MVDGVVLHKIGWCITCDANDCQHIQDANQSLINSMSRPMIDAVEWSPKHHGHMPLYWKPDMEASLDGKSFVHQDWAWIAGSTYHVPYEAVHGGPRPEVVEGDAGAGLDLIERLIRTREYHAMMYEQYDAVTEAIDRIEALQARVAFLEDGMNKAHPLIQSEQYEGSIENINQDRWLKNWFDDEGELK